MLSRFIFVTTVDFLSEFTDAWPPASMSSAVTVPCCMGKREKGDVPAARNLCRKSIFIHWMLSRGSSIKKPPACP